MSLGRITKLLAVTTLATLGLVACGSNAENAPTEVTSRQAGMAPPRNVELCVSREASAGPMTVTFRNSESSYGNGPFTLDYVQCGESPMSGLLRLDINDAEGTRVIYMAAQNVNIGYPLMNIKSVTEGVDETYTFNEGEIHNFEFGLFSVRVERQPDTDTSKSFRAWVSRP